MRHINEVSLLGKIVSEIEHEGGHYEFTLKTVVTEKNRKYETDHVCRAYGDKFSPTMDRLRKGDHLLVRGALAHDKNIVVIDLINLMKDGLALDRQR